MASFNRSSFAAGLRCAAALTASAALALGTLAEDAAPKRRKVTANRGTVLELSLLEPLASDAAKVGDDISLQTTRPLASDGVIILPEGSVVHGRVISVTRAGNNCKPGRLKWKLEPAITPAGAKIQLKQIQAYQARPHGQVLDRVSLGSAEKNIQKGAIFALVAPIFAAGVVLLLPEAIALSIRGEQNLCTREGFEAYIPEGHLFYAAVAKDTRVHIIP